MRDQKENNLHLDSQENLLLKLSTLDLFCFKETFSYVPWYVASENHGTEIWDCLRMLRPIALWEIRYQAECK